MLRSVILFYSVLLFVPLLHAVSYDELVTKTQEKAVKDQRYVNYKTWTEAAEQQKDEEIAKAIIADVQRQLAQQDFSIKQENPVDDASIISLPQMQRDYQSIAAAVANGGEKFEKNLFILVSISMPTELLKKLDAVAERIGARLVLRGFKENSFKKTIAHIKQLQEQGIRLEINPNLFKVLRVEMVPSFVLVDGSKIDIMQGNVSLPYVLEKFAESGDAKELAQKYLKALGS